MSASTRWATPLAPAAFASRKDASSVSADERSPPSVTAGRSSNRWSRFYLGEFLARLVMTSADRNDASGPSNEPATAAPKIDNKAHRLWLEFEAAQHQDAADIKPRPARRAETLVGESASGSHRRADGSSTEIGPPRRFRRPA